MGITAGFGSDYSSIVAPLRIGDQPLGVIALAHHTAGRYGHEAQNMLSTFASYAAVAIENTRLYDQAQEQAYASAALLQVAQAVVSLNDLTEILGTIVRIMPILVGVRRTVLYRFDEGLDRFIPIEEYGFDEIDEPLFQRSLAPVSSSFSIPPVKTIARLCAHSNSKSVPGCMVSSPASL